MALFLPPKSILCKEGWTKRIFLHTGVCSYLWYHNSVFSLSGWAVTYKLLKKNKSCIPVAHMKLNAIKHLKVWNCCFCLSKHFYSHTQTINWEPSCKASFQISCLINKSHFFMPERSIPLLIHLAHDRWPAAVTMGAKSPMQQARTEWI